MGIFKRKTASAGSLSEVQPENRVETERIGRCFCAHGHDLFSQEATFSGHPGITLKLRNERQEGLLSLSPIIGDKDRAFFGADWAPGEIVEICCHVCSEPLPLYNQCFCGADLVAIFTTAGNDFANCIGICQRIGCTHAEINSNRHLRVDSRSGFHKA
ncbi:MAG: hypothetical protein C0616_07540 [Desulfuromonas sp.]|nr:MAG: hypothetical protein C0616_07540 [Desulfuromonas sp.]